jgi:hypothetical protein
LVLNKNVSGSPTSIAIKLPLRRFALGLVKFPEKAEIALV